MPPIVANLAALLSAHAEATAFVVLVIIQALDVLSGWLSAYVRNEISSKVSWRGVARKALTLVAVAAVASLLPLFRYLPVPPSLIIIPVQLYFIGTDLISIAENLARAGVANPMFSHLAEVVRRTATDALQVADEVAPRPALPDPDPAAPRPRLLAVFPALPGLDPLNYAEEQRILREAGGPWSLLILTEGDATRGGIARELHVGQGARLLYIGSHGSDGRIALSDGDYATRQWLASIIRYYAIEALILNACYTDDLVEACLAAGAKAVVTTSDRIENRDAGKLAASVVQALAWGETVRRAVDYALVTLGDAASDLVRLRGNEAWSWAGAA